MKAIQKKKIIILALVIGLIVVITPMLGTQLNRVIKKNKLYAGFFKIESVECTDKFGKDTVLKIRSKWDVFYTAFPQTIIAMNYSIYFDNITSFKCQFSFENEHFSFILELKMDQGVKEQKLYYKVLFHYSIKKWSYVFDFDRLGGDINVTFIMGDLIIPR